MAENQRLFSDADAQNSKHPVHNQILLQKRATELKTKLDAMTEFNFEASIQEEYLNIMDILEPLDMQMDTDGFVKRFYEKHAELRPKMEEPLDYKRALTTNQSTSHRRRGIKFGLSVLAAACLITAMCMTALGTNIFEKLAKWTADAFSFNQNADTQNDNAGTVINPTFRGELGDKSGIIMTEYPTQQFDGYTSFHEVLKEQDTSAVMIPTYIPSDFQLCNVTKIESEIKVEYTARYTSISEEKVLLIILSVYHEPVDGVSLQKDNNPIEIYNANGTDFYIMSNLERMSATAFSGNVEIIISGDITTEVLKQMIDSANKGVNREK